LFRYFPKNYIDFPKKIGYIIIVQTNNKQKEQIMKYIVGYIADTRAGTFKVKKICYERSQAETILKQLFANFPKHICPPNYEILTEEQFRDRIKFEKAVAIEKRKATIARKAAKSPTGKIEKKFVLCPACNGKTKKLGSEMGGLQTRKCSHCGKVFGYDTFGGGGRYTTPGYFYQ
jgi:hypothetical protein